MKLKINRGLLPIKAHFFFFFAALGPLLPQMNVFGRQLGVSPAVMGMVTAVLPLLWAAAKPLFGYVVDFWPTHRKLVFMLLIALMTGSYCGLWFIPTPDPPETQHPLQQYVYHLNDTITLKTYRNETHLDKYNCRWNCSVETEFSVYLSNSTIVDSLYVDGSVDYGSCSLFHMDWGEVREGQMICIPMSDCHLLCFDYDEEFVDVFNSTNSLPSGRVLSSTDSLLVSNTANKSDVPSSTDSFLINNGKNTQSFPVNNTANARDVPYNTESLPINNGRDTNSLPISNGKDTNSLPKNNAKDTNSLTISDNANRKDVPSSTDSLPINNGRGTNSLQSHEPDETGSFYMTVAFWAFVVLMCVGTVAFNVANCIGDAVCFDVLGPDRSSKYGAQRAWGTAGYGVTALLGGWLVDKVSPGEIKDFTPAFVIALVATGVDLYACRALTLPPMSSPDDSGAALRQVLRMPKVLVFIMFAIVAGTFDSFIIYYMFWFLEELAETTGHMAQIKLIEGVIVAGQSFLGEMLFFYFSGKIIKRWGFGVTMSVALGCYGVRMGLISLIQSPWHLVFIESIMQGPTYALCYSCIVGYAAHVAPEGYSATVQGIVAGMDDGVGFAVGSLLGGQMYARIGGRASFQILGGVAIFAALAHAVIYVIQNRQAMTQESKHQPELPEGQKMLPEPQDHNAIYRETVVPIIPGKS